MDHGVMDHGLMTGMFWGGLLMMAVPVLFALGVGVFLLHRHLTTRDDEDEERIPGRARPTP